MVTPSTGTRVYNPITSKKWSTKHEITAVTLPSTAVLNEGLVENNSREQIWQGSGHRLVCCRQLRDQA